MPLTTAQARTVELRKAIVLDPKLRIPILDTYCAGCRQVFEDCADRECPAPDARKNEHLRGGMIGERKKRGPQHQPLDIDESEIEADSYTGEVG